MSLGVLEIVIVAASFVSLGCVAFFFRQWLAEHRWLVAVPFLILTAAMTTPADPASTLVVAVPHMVLFAVLLRWCVARRSTV